MNLKGKVAFITGAGGGIGGAAAKKCAQYGAQVVVADLAVDAAEKVAQEIRESGGDAISVKIDVTSRESVKAAVDSALEKYGRIDCLFNNAGVCKSSMMIDGDDKMYDFMMNINAKGAFIVATEIAKVMVKQKKGRIVSTSSISAFKEEYSNGIYCMSKAAVATLTRHLALELSPYGVTAVAIAPGHIQTQLLHGSFVERGKEEGKPVEDFYDEMKGTIPMGRLGQPEEIGDLVAFLFDDRSAYIDGNNILIAGGKIMG
jgi:NAD(P)-dependent dehydrogenase (short-subunit alcohol dehydrogenase family)